MILQGCQPNFLFMVANVPLEGIAITITVHSHCPLALAEGSVRLFPLIH